jgi:hypothetical protein
MATAAEVGLTPQEAGQAQAALTRLQGRGQVNGRFEQVTRRPAQENAAFWVTVHFHDGPAGHGRTIFVETIKGNLLIRRTVGEGSHGMTSDGWLVIELTNL